MGASLFLGALLLVIAAVAVVTFWPRGARRRDSTFVDHSEFDYDETSHEQTHASSSHDGPHDS